jgi:hypothetical protein
LFAFYAHLWLCVRSEAKGETGQREGVMARVGMLAARLLKNNARCHGSYLISHVLPSYPYLFLRLFFSSGGGGGGVVWKTLF